MTDVPTVEARQRFSEIVSRAAYGKERIVLTRRGNRLAAIVPIEDIELLEALENRLDLEDARAALSDSTEKGTIPWQKIKADLGL
ncbi:MAG: type II toxin-antitoxin system Phd/YefM family antitoxin [Chloroflexi bacterium]|nr:type II toxin-antitoxin system Phd/YefM family antitoxin [Chloroflexota bacterium]